MTPAPESLATGWSLDLAEDIDLPGWVFLPYELAEDLRSPWAEEVAAAILDLARELRPEEPPPSEDDVRALLAAGLDARDSSTSALLYLVFPTAEAVAVFCSVDLVRAADLPDFPRDGGRLYAAEARYIGPGLQFSTRRMIEDDGVENETASVHLVFVDEQEGIIISLGEGGSLVVTRSLVGLGLLKNAIVVRRPDGATLSSVAPPGLVADTDWDTDEGTVS